MSTDANPSPEFGASTARRLRAIPGGKPPAYGNYRTPFLPDVKDAARSEMLRQAVRDLLILAYDEELPAEDRDKILFAATTAGQVRL